MNLELALANRPGDAVEGASTLVPAGSPSTAEQQGAENALFSLVREQEQNRWKSSTLDGGSGGGVDY